MCHSKLSTFVLFICAIGAINWGLVGVIDRDLVKWLADTVQYVQLAKIIYIVVGICGLYGLYESLVCTFAKQQ